MTGRTRNETTLLITNGKKGSCSIMQNRSLTLVTLGFLLASAGSVPAPASEQACVIVLEGRNRNRDGGRGSQRGVRTSRGNPYRALRELGRVLELQPSSRGRESVSRLEARGRSIDEAALEFLHHGKRGISGARL